MKVIGVFVHVFAIFAFLTLGSFMIIVSLHVLTMEDALLKVQELYEDPWKSFQTGVTGLLFVFSGLMFTRILLKRIRPDDQVALYGKLGPITVSIRAIEDVVHKGLRKFDVVREVRIETRVESNQLHIVANLGVLAGWNLPELIHMIQKELRDRLTKILGSDIELEPVVNVVKIIEQPALAGGG